MEKKKKKEVRSATDGGGHEDEHVAEDDDVHMLEKLRDFLCVDMRTYRHVYRWVYRMQDMVPPTSPRHGRAGLRAI